MTEITIYGVADRWGFEGIQCRRTVNEIWRKHGISLAAYYKWKSKRRHGSVRAQMVKELEAENARLKRMYAELAQENEAIKAVLLCAFEDQL